MVQASPVHSTGRQILCGGENVNSVECSTVGEDLEMFNWW